MTEATETQGRQPRTSRSRTPQNGGTAGKPQSRRNRRAQSSIPPITPTAPAENVTASEEQLAQVLTPQVAPKLRQKLDEMPETKVLPVVGEYQRLSALFNEGKDIKLDELVNFAILLSALDIVQDYVDAEIKNAVAAAKAYTDELRKDTSVAFVQIVDVTNRNATHTNRNFTALKGQIDQLKTPRAAWIIGILVGLVFAFVYYKFDWVQAQTNVFDGKQVERLILSFVAFCLGLGLVILIWRSRWKKIEPLEDDEDINTLQLAHPALAGSHPLAVGDHADSSS